MGRDRGRARPFRAAARRVCSRRRILTVLFTGTGVWLLVVGWQLLLARAEADQARELLRRAQSELDVDALLDGGDPVRLQEARRLFAAAEGRVGSLLMTPLRVAPFLGRQLDAFESIAGAAGDVVGIGLDGLEEAQAALDDYAPGDEVTVTGRLVAATHVARDRLADVDLGPGDDLLGPLATAWHEASTEVDELRATVADAVAAADGILGLLAGDSRYLLLAANNAEMRAGSGMYLSAGELSISDGSFELGPMEPTPSLFLPEGAVSLDGIEGADDMEARWGWLHPTQEWRNLNLTPRFDVSAALAARMWVASGGRAVEGVLAVDVVALQAILGATGPVQLDGITVGVDTVVDEVLLEQYRRYPDIAERDERRDALGRLATAALDGLDRRRLDVRALVRGLADAIAGRHVLAWSDGDDEALWDAVGADGRLGPDSLLVSVLNRGGNKLDQFLHVESALRLGAQGPGDRRTATVEVTLRSLPPENLPAYVAGPHPNSELDPREYGGLLTVNLPGAAEDVEVQGGGAVAVAGRDGPTFVVGVPIELGPGDEVVVTITCTLPVDDAPVLEPAARVPPLRWTGDADA